MLHPIEKTTQACGVTVNSIFFIFSKNYIVMDSEDEMEVIGSILGGIWDAFTAPSYSAITEIEDQINKNSFLFEIDTTNREFAFLEENYGVTQIPYYVVVKGKQVLVEGPVDGTFLYVIDQKFRKHEKKKTQPNKLRVDRPRTEETPPDIIKE